MAEAESYLISLVARRSKLLERLGGEDWDDLEEIRDQIGDRADEYSDYLADAVDELITQLESQRIAFDESSLANLDNQSEWSILQRWGDVQVERAQAFADQLLEQFDEQVARVAGR